MQSQVKQLRQGDINERADIHINGTKQNPEIDPHIYGQLVSTKLAINMTSIHMQKNINFNKYFTAYTKTIKLQEENNLCDPGTQRFLRAG